jgi:hypothetical protein
MTKRKPSPLDGLRTAAHVRHAAVVASAWWWCPPIMMARLARHADIVDDFYDVLDGENDE